MTLPTLIDPEDRAAALRIRDEMEGILTRLDGLRLHLAGAHLAQSIHCVEQGAGLERDDPLDSLVREAQELGMGY